MLRSSLLDLLQSSKDLDIGRMPIKIGIFPAEPSFLFSFFKSLGLSDVLGLVELASP